MEGLDGEKKMSKSLNNYVGITEPPEEIFGKIMSINDDLMLRYYDLVSGLPAAEIAKIKDDLKAEKLHPKAAKMRLAHLLVERFYNTASASAAQVEFESIFKEGNLPQDIALIKISVHEIKNGKIWLARAMVVCGVAESSTDARRLIVQGGVKVNGQKITDEKAEIYITNEVLLQVGKRRFVRVRCE